MSRFPRAPFAPGSRGPSNATSPSPQWRHPRSLAAAALGSLSLFALSSCGYEESLSTGELSDSRIFTMSMGLGVAAVQGRVDSQGVLRFSHEVEGRREDFINEFAGDLTVDGAKVYHRNRGVNTRVGTVKGESFEVCTGEFHKACDISFARKAPNAEFVGDRDVYSVKLTHKSPRTATAATGTQAHRKLEPFVFSSPNQNDAGSCLYMALTGAMEILLNQRASAQSRLHDGPTDLSERFLMNVGATRGREIKDWRTDSIYLFNREGGALRNRDYRYTKGWFVDSGSGLRKAKSGVAGARYGTSFNWINEYSRPLKSKLIKTPQVERKVIFAEPTGNQWNTGVMDDKMIARIKEELRTRNAPVVFIYNHFGYWHAVLIVGFDDTKANEGCTVVNRWVDVMQRKVAEDKNSRDGSRRARARTTQQYVTQVRSSLAKSGTCSKRGVFFVRDSIYNGPASDLYDYDPSSHRDDAPYSTRIVEHSYDWAKHLGNHAYVVYGRE